MKEMQKVNIILDKSQIAQNDVKKFIVEIDHIVNILTAIVKASQSV